MVGCGKERRPSLWFDRGNSLVPRTQQQSPGQMLTPFVHITKYEGFSRILQLLPSSVLEPTHVNLQEPIVCIFSWFHNQHNGGFKLASAGIFTPQKLEELFKSGLFFLPDCWLFNNSLAHRSTPLNSSLMLGFPSCCCMPCGHTWNPEDRKASLRRGALLRPL